ncbi:PREDICTED: adenomatous polyposis coli protein-like [Dufourea novaeangliae]|uniref:Adenomatous polyposis coli protein n=1 Tax=Dufourea novaeangliae TaxID=178035 RepID=A0A154PC29_DUFNO|nr:PREDICTED: adenomatous polyposis coli protein-like [Dufourea novaeangliae]KZC08828.1 Adenomatous polyposis coli protein [Dufourea novaeangliae]
MEKSTGRRYEEEASEQLVDYSKKYIERKTIVQDHPIENSSRDGRSCKKEFRERNSKVDLFGDYAETDLDQPTDYSLRYAEDDTDDDEKQSPEYFSGSVQEDTVKTYCTEGTPYETPFNFSTATSMSDLRLEDSKESTDTQKKPTKKAHDRDSKEDLSFEHNLPMNCNENQSLLDEKELEAPKPSQTCKPSRLSPEKMLDYYQPGTSDGFSRVNSLSSLGSAMTQRNNNTGITSKVSSTDSTDKIDSGSERADCNGNGSAVNGLRISNEADSPAEGKNNSRVVDKEGKMVTFSRQDFYAEQTPLMFSRCSSLGSLSGFEQHSIHDDRSSIISDFSRRTSGVVSPSELPDSPTQTIPSSPRNHKSQCSDFVSKTPEEAVRPTVRHLSYSKCHAPRISVFEDDIATFKEESTPIEFSTATSLSSLTIDDEVKITETTKAMSEVKVASNDTDKNTKEGSCEEKTTNVEVEKDQEQVSDGDEDDEDMLAACISMGIKNNRYRQSFKTSTAQKSIQSESSNMLARCQQTAVINRLEPRVPVTNVDTPATTTKVNKSTIEVVAAPDTVHVYCTEDTPADISPVGSQSNLSALSMPSVQEDVERIEGIKLSGEVECHRNDLSDESSNLSGEDEKMLDECIQSGIPKVRQITPPPTSCITFAQKTEVPTQRFNKCGTPSSSPVENAKKNAILGKSLCRAILQHNDLSDESPNHSDDEAILSECIRSAMPKVRLNISTLMGQSLPPIVDKTKATTTRKPSTSASYRQPEYTERSKHHQSKKPIPFEDTLSLSEEEEDIMLAQCIKSGIPKAVNASSSSSLISRKQADQYSKVRIASGSSYVNKSYSSRNATVQSQSVHKPVGNDASMHGGSSGVAHSAKNSEIRRLIKNGGMYERNPLQSYNRKLSVDHEQQQQTVNETGSNFPRSQIPPNCRSPISNGTDNDDDDQCRGTTKSNVAPSRHSSVSSLSEESSLGSIEEWALLELCIIAGMPRNKYRLKGMKSAEGSSHEERDTIPEDNYSICSYNSYVCKT